MDKRVLLLDTNFSAKPIYDYLIKSNYTVFVMGNNPNDFLAKISENYINQNYADINAVQEFIVSLKIDFLVPGGNDFSYKICSIINDNQQFYNIDSLNKYELINNKKKFREFATNANLHVPIVIENEADKKNLPLIVKPVDAYSGHGMTVIDENNFDDLEKAIDYAKSKSKTDDYVLEQFIKGQLYSHSAFIIDGEIVEDFIVKEYCSTNQYVVDISFVVNDFEKQILQSIRNDIEIIAEELKLNNGLIHTQFIADGDTFWLIELTRRCPGDLYSQLIEFSTNFPYAEYYTKPFLDKKNVKYKGNIENKHIVRHTLSLKEKDVFNSLVFNQHFDVVKYIPLLLPGDTIEPSPFGRIGLLFAKYETESELVDSIPLIQSKELYSINT